MMTLDELIALNDEIAALVRSGVPLEAGLTELGADLPGRLGRLATALAQRTARGEPLSEAVAADAGQFPRVYRAVVEAGVRAGRLPAALEAVANAARRLAETRREVVLAIVHPMLVMLVAWACLLLLTCCLAPHLAADFQRLGLSGARYFSALAWIGRGAWYWGPVAPLAAGLLVLAWWFAGTGAVAFEGRWCDRLFGPLPWMARMLRYSYTATFLELLALLVENRTPLAEAVTLAAEASGDRNMLAAARRMAQVIESGQVGATAAGESPPLVDWLLVALGRDGRLLPAVRHAAAAYRRRARRQAELLRLLLPVILTVGVAGVATAGYALTVFVPYISALRSLGG